MDRIRERVEFLRQFRRAFHATGALQPSSRHLARAMTDPLRSRRATQPDRPCRIIELGPGTGAVTRAIGRAMGPHDRLDCYEINPDFAAYLQRLIARDPSLRSVADRVRVHRRPAQQAAADAPIDFVVCSIPLNNLRPGEVREILERALSLLAVDGFLSYFEYLWLPRLRRLFVPAAERDRIDGVRAVKRAVPARPAGTSVVLLNLPPARAVHLQPIPPTRSDAGRSEHVVQPLQQAVDVGRGVPHAGRDA